MGTERDGREAAVGTGNLEVSGGHCRLGHVTSLETASQIFQQRTKASL